MTSAIIEGILEKYKDLKGYLKAIKPNVDLQSLIKFLTQFQDQKICEKSPEWKKFCEQVSKHDF